MITINYLMAQALLVLRAKLKKENTAGRIGGLFRDILLFIQNMILGIILKGSLANEAAIKAVVDPVRGDTYKAIDTGHYWCYDGIRWNDIGELIPANMVTKDYLNSEVNNNLSDLEGNKALTKDFGFTHNWLIGNVITIPVGQTGATSYTYAGYLPFRLNNVKDGDIIETLTVIRQIQGQLFDVDVFNDVIQKYDSANNYLQFYPRTVIEKSQSDKDGIRTFIIRSEGIVDFADKAWLKHCVQINNTIVVENVPVKFEFVENRCFVRRTVKSAIQNIVGSLNSHKYIDSEKSLTPLFRLNGANGGAGGNRNYFIVPAGFTGTSTYSEVNYPKLSDLGMKTGDKVTFYATIDSENFSMSFNNFSIVLQKYDKDNKYLGNIPVSELDVQSIFINSGRLKIIYTVTITEDLYSIRPCIQFRNSVVATAQLKFTFTEVFYTHRSVGVGVDMGISSNTETIRDIVSSLSNNSSINNTQLLHTVEAEINRMYAGFHQLSVKKDATGDFTSIQAAIDSIKDASISNQYEVVIHDDWVITDVTDLRLLSGNSTQLVLFETKDYVSVRGNGSMKRIEVSMPNDIAADKIMYVQPIYHRGWSRIENLHIVTKNSRYCIHTEGGGYGDKDKKQVLVNCVLDHLGNQDAVNFSSWQSDMAWGFGNSVGQFVEARNCRFIARQQAITYHTNTNYIYPTKLSLINCELSTRDLNSYTAMNASDMGSTQTHELELIGCKIRGHIGCSSLLYLNTTTMTDGWNGIWNVYGHNNSQCSITNGQPKVLNFKSKVYKNISVIGGTAKNLIYGFERYTRKAYTDLQGLCAGSTYIAGDTESYTPFYGRTLGYLLGDCRTVNKTLILKIGSDTITITFDKNYGSANPSVAPAYTTAEIMAEINTKLGSYATAYSILGNWYFPIFSDCYDNVFNSSTTDSIFEGMGVVYDRGKIANSVRKAVAGEKIDGIAQTDIPYSTNGKYDNEYGKILLPGRVDIQKDVAYKPYNIWAADITGKILKIGSTPGIFVETNNFNECVVYAINSSFWRIK